MNTWRGDLGTIKKILTGDESTEGWREDLNAIARNTGVSASNWREAVQIWAQSHGVNGENWRSYLTELAKSLTEIPPSSWREALQFICMYYEGNPLITDRLKQLYTSDGMTFILSDGKIFLTNEQGEKHTSIYTGIEIEKGIEKLLKIGGIQ